MLRVDEKGTPDRCEFFGVLKDELLGIAPVFNQPAVIEAHKELYISFTKRAHELALIILANLERSLHLPPGTLDSLHRISAPSHNQTRLIRYHPQPATDRRTSFVAHSKSSDRLQTTDRIDRQLNQKTNPRFLPSRFRIRHRPIQHSRRSADPSRCFNQ
jgi:hypothetical protein